MAMKRNIISALALAMTLAVPGAAFAGHAHRDTSSSNFDHRGYSATARSFAATNHRGAAASSFGFRSVPAAAGTFHSARSNFSPPARWANFARNTARFTAPPSGSIFAPVRANAFAAAPLAAPCYNGYRYAAPSAIVAAPAFIPNHREPDRDDYRGTYAANPGVTCDADGDECVPASGYGGAYNSGYAGAYLGPQYSVVQMPGESLMAYRARLIQARDQAKIKAVRAIARHDHYAAARLHATVSALNSRIAQVDRQLGYASYTGAQAYAPAAYNYVANGSSYAPYGSPLGGTAAALGPLIQQFIP
jgi:hypothetical protein